MLAKSQRYLPHVTFAFMMMAGYATASGKVFHAPAAARQQVEQIRAFETGQVPARRFSFENYSFRSLDAAVQKQFPAGTPQARVDAALKGEGGAVKASGNDGAVDYVRAFQFGRWDCRRVVTVQFDSQKRVVSARGDGQCG